jgi:putative oxidoreductase
MKMSDLALALLRIVPGLLLFFFHGQSKLVSAFSYVVSGTEWRFIEGVGKLGFPAPAFFAVCAALAEGVGSLLLVAGLFTRYASIFICFTMLVATYRHATTDMRYELAAVYAVISFAFIFLHPGKISLDAAWRKRKQ